MRLDLKRAQSVEVALDFVHERQRWVAYCATFNLTAWGMTRAMAIDRMRIELEDEERCSEDFEPSMGPPPPVNAEVRIIERLRSGGWAR